MQRNEIKIILDGLLKDNKKRNIHISLSNRRFYNGVVLNYEDDKSLSFEDNKLGYITILYSSIINIEPEKEKWQ